MTLTMDDINNILRAEERLSLSLFDHVYPDDDLYHKRYLWDIYLRYNRNIIQTLAHMPPQDMMKLLHWINTEAQP